MNDSDFYISTSDALQRLVQKIDAIELIAVDTEADSLHHYFEKVCLIQISVAGSDFIVDPLADLDITPLLKVLSQKTLILHGADYDLRMLSRNHKFVPSRIFDTATAAQLLGYSQIGLAALVEHHCAVRLSKGKQKADWSRRPLTDDLVHYAVNDTRYLAQVAESLRVELEAKGRLVWHAEMCEASIAAALADRVPIDMDRLWRVKGWQQLRSRRAQAVLRQLWHWRDAEARRVDLPSFKIISNECLLALSSWAGDTEGEPAAMPRLPRNCVGRRLSGLKAALVAGQKLPESEWPKPLRPTKTRVAPANSTLYSRIKHARDAVAASLGLEASLIAPAAAIGAIARVLPHSPEELKATADLYWWQTALLAPTILPLVEAHVSLQTSKHSRNKDSIDDHDPPPAG